MLGFGWLQMKDSADALPTTANKPRAPRNRTIEVLAHEALGLDDQVIALSGPASASDIRNRIICQDLFQIIDWLPRNCVNLLFIDPPYNLTKRFNTNTFRERSIHGYASWLESWLVRLLPTLTANASVYICGDWRSSAAIHFVAEKHLHIRNRITWEREKGRGSETNWKNCSEDVWFCTASDEFVFNLDAVKLKRRVIAPYTENGKPKDWNKTESGNYRLTHPSNLWTDITIPFWSMPENTDHPTQKPEKLLAKIILASSQPGDLLLDPFVGSGTSAVVAKKTGRNFVGIEVDRSYCLLAQKRLMIAAQDGGIQGYSEGVFWERNSLVDQRAVGKGSSLQDQLPFLATASNNK
jgi:site-specific DNA-methyltransferase (adenine-specific)